MPHSVSAAPDPRSANTSPSTARSTEEAALPQRTVVIHISDLHIHRLSWKPWRYASKRMLGAANLILQRAQIFTRVRQQRLIDQIDAMDWDHLLISGDLTQLALPEEFQLAREMLAPLLERGPARVCVLPGNHDRYIREPPGKGEFERYFGAFAAPADPRGGILTRQLTHHWWLIAWDSAWPAPWFSAEGWVHPRILEQSEAFLAQLPPQARTLLVTHYPAIYPPEHPFPYQHRLRNQEEVQRWVLEHPIDLYLHGHLHENWVLHAREGERPLRAVNSGASPLPPVATASSSFHRIILEGDKAEIQGLQVEPNTPAKSASTG